MSRSLKCLSCPLTSNSGPLTTTVSQWKTLPKSGPTVKKLEKMKTIVNIFLFYSLTALLHIDGNDNWLKTSLGLAESNTARPELTWVKRTKFRRFLVGLFLAWLFWNITISSSEVNTVLNLALFIILLLRVGAFIYFWLIHPNVHPHGQV